MSHGLQYVANCSILFSERPLLERPAEAKGAGFDAVEFWWPFADVVPPDADIDRFVAAIEDAGVHLIGLNFAAGDMSSGERGLLSIPSRSHEFRDNIDVTVGIGERLGTMGFNALYGNRVDDALPGQQDELAAENLAIAAKAASHIGAVVLLEPISGAAHFPLLTAKDVVDVIERVERESGVDNLWLLADLYHLTVNGDNLSDAITEYASRIGHVQIADAPGRHEPGTGEFDLEKYLCQLEAVGYSGFVGLEYVPSRTTDESLEWLPRHRRAASFAFNSNTRSNIDHDPVTEKL